MSNKYNKRVAMDLALTTAENITDEIVFKTATTFIEDLIKSVPFSPIVTSLISAYSNFETTKKQRQLFNFIQQTEEIDHGFIAKFFREKSNSELGFEILGILDQTYLEQQARMVSRAVILLQKNAISKQEFDKYTYIITKLNSHLIYLINLFIEVPKNYETEIDETNHPSVSSVAGKINISFSNPNMDLVSFGFLETKVITDAFGKSLGNSADYSLTQDFYDFYNNIFKD